MSATPKKPGGLAGVYAGETAICTVGKEGFGLSYRGYTIEDLAAKARVRGGRLPAALRRTAHPRATRPITARSSPGCAACRTRSRPRSNSCPPTRTRWTSCARVAPSWAAWNRNAAWTAPSALAAGNRLIAAFPSMLLYWYHFTQARPAHRNADRRPQHRRAFPAPAAGQTRAGIARPRDGRFAGPLRRTRVQRLDLHRARHHLHAGGFPQRHRRRHRGVARSAARRGQRGGDGLDRPLPDARRSRGGTARKAGAARNSSWVSATAFTRRPTRVRRSSRSSRRTLAAAAGDTADLSGQRTHRRRDAAGERDVHRTWISTARRPTASWASRRRCSRRSS